MSSEQNAGQNHTINTNLAKWKFKYFGTIVNQHCMYEDIKSRLNSEKPPFGPQSCLFPFAT